MKLSMTVDASVTLEWEPNLQIRKATFRELPEQNRRGFFVLELGSDERVQGTMSEVITGVRDRIENKKLGEGFLPTLMAAMDSLVTQAIPEVVVDREALIDEAVQVKRRRRAWLLEQIEEGSYAAIELLKEEFGESVRITVEVLGEAA